MHVQGWVIVGEVVGAWVMVHKVGEDQCGWEMVCVGLCVSPLWSKTNTSDTSPIGLG